MLDLKVIEAFIADGNLEEFNSNPNVFIEFCKRNSFTVADKDDCDVVLSCMKDDVHDFIPDSDGDEILSLAKKHLEESETPAYIVPFVDVERMAHNMRDVFFGIDGFIFYE